MNVSYNIRHLEAELVQFTRELDLLQVLGDASGNAATQAKKSELAACVGELETMGGRLNNLLKAVEFGGDVALLVQRLRESEAAVIELKKRRLGLQVEVGALANAALIERSSYETISRLLGQLHSNTTSLDEKLSLRFRMLTEVQKTVCTLHLFPGGNYYDNAKLERLTEGLRENGYDDDRITSYVQGLPTKADRAERYFIAFMRNGMTRVVKGGEAVEVNTHWASQALAAIRARGWS